MESTRDPDQTRKTFRLLAVAAGVWFLGSGIWGLVTETPADRASAGCESAARAKSGDSNAGVQMTTPREGQDGWSVAGELLQDVNGAVVTTYRWECLADADGRAPEITTWTPAG